jgi:signal transduction histidine kinase/CheY-like chemotaxis protein
MSLDERRVLEAAPIAIVVVGPDGRVVFANAKAESCFGWGARDLVGHSLTQILAEPLGGEGDHIVIGRHRDGRELTIDLSVARPGGTADTVIAIRDVTGRKEADQRILIADRLASVGTLAAGVAHEINNPLATLMGNLELSLRTLGDQPADVVEQLRDAAQAADRVREIVRDLKLLSRAEDEKLVAVDVDRIVDATLRVAAHTIKARARTERHLGAPPPVLANEAKLGQVILNLVINAAQAIPEGAPDRNVVSVTTGTSADGRVVIRVADTGVGVKPEVRARLFDPFFTTKPVGVGTGLGLTICHRIVNGLGGDLTFTSEVGQGSEFKVVLPAAGTVTPGARAAGPAQPEARRGRVLVVDDEPLILRTIKRILVDHDVTTYDSAAAALDALRGGARFDLILCDLMMPEVTGIDLHEQLRAIAPDQVERLVFMTGGTFTARSREFLASVSNPRIDKPFDAASLRTMVNGMLGPVS